MKKDDICAGTDEIAIGEVPETITCPKCGGEIGLWTESVLTVCWFCGFHAFRKETIIN